MKRSVRFFLSWFYSAEALKWSSDSKSVPVAQWWNIVLTAQKVVGSIPREHTYWQKMYSLNALLVALDKSVF